MKKIKLIIALVAVFALVSSSPAYAAGFAPGEGLYVGGFGGTGVGIVQPRIEATSQVQTSNSGGTVNGTYETTEGGIGLAGIEGGGLVGYGYKMGDFYAGLEGEMAAGDVKFKLTSSNPIELDGEATVKTITEIEATKEWTGGMFGRLGFYINDDTLLSFKGGVLVSKFEVKTVGTNSNFSEDYYGGGPSFGTSLESRIAAIDPNLSLRIGVVYTDFLTASVHSLGSSNAGSRHDSEITGSALSARIGVQYSFFDVNSLF